jgi:hypothetical protein
VGLTKPKDLRSKWWPLAIPHDLVVGFLAAGGSTTELVSLLVLIAGMELFTPRPARHLSTSCRGMNRRACASWSTPGC